jgi:glycerol-3-phosphate cytidylyltransferase-like family protein
MVCLRNICINTLHKGGDDDDDDDDDDNNNNNKNLKIEIQRTCNVKTKVMPVIRVANGTFSGSLRKYRSNIPGKYVTNKNGFEEVFIVCPPTHEPTV